MRTLRWGPVLPQSPGVDKRVTEATGAEREGEHGLNKISGDSSPPEAEIAL